MKRITILWVGLLLSLNAANAQNFRHYDFLGAGHDNEVVVTASSSANGTIARKTVDGFPIQNQDQLREASRFLAQATFGADYATIEMTAAMGYEAWLDEQFALPRSSYVDEMLVHALRYSEEEEEEEELEIGPEYPIWHEFFRSAWVDYNLTTPDLLRQRMAFNLSQLMVINDNSDFFEDVGQLMGVYYDMLAENSFENYQKLLTDVTLSPAMGIFLSHYNNPKEDLANNIHPDENYAREIMQLFSIGLWELNPDGTRKYDAQGQFIPTYTNRDIKEFAQVFTGLGNGTPAGEFGIKLDELVEEVVPIVQVPMKMYDAFHDKSEKRLLNGTVLPAGQGGMTDILLTMEHLANHPNTAPFISRALIQKMTTSNPSPRYVREVAAVFDPDVPHNFQEVLKAILLHPEARNCSIPTDYQFGKLREPVVRMLNYLRAFPMNANEYGDYFYRMECYGANTGQSPLEAPSVFNFFLPDYSPPGPINQNYLVGPEFQILNATNAIGLVNDVNTRAIKRAYLMDLCASYEADEEEGEDDEEEDGLESYDSYTGYFMDYDTEQELAEDPAVLVDWLDILLANGLLTDDTKAIIVNAVNQVPELENRIKMAIYLILIAPDYAILK